MRAIIPVAGLGSRLKPHTNTRPKVLLNFGGRPETPAQNDIPDLIVQWNIFKKSGFKKPPGTEALSILEHGSDEPKCWWTNVDKIGENDYNLSAGRYKPQITQKVSDENPVELIKDVIELENKITGKLNKLLKDIEVK